MSKLLPPESKRAIGFIIVDANAGTPLALTGSGLLRPSKEPSFFRITPRDRPGSRRTPLELGYRHAHRKAQTAIARHVRVAGVSNQIQPTIKTLYSS
jgi:hypothetical protein